VTTTGLYEQIKNDCGYLKLGRAAEVFANLADDAKAHHWNHIEFLARLLDELVGSNPTRGTRRRAVCFT
jgi:hypothetical protein